MKGFLFFLFSSFSLLFASIDETSLPHAQTDEEALFLRRVVEFWQDGEYEIARSQMEEFLEIFPDTSIAEYLYALLGDIYMHDEKYDQALLYYDKVQEEDTADKVLLNRLQCLFNLGWYATLSEECNEILKNVSSFDKSKALQIQHLYGISLYTCTVNCKDDLEQRLEFAKKAKELLEPLKGTSFDEPEYLAFILFVLGESEKASQIFVELAEKNPNKKEELLFSAADLQAQFNKELAIQTYGQISYLGQSRAKDAAFNRMVLFFETERYAEIILAKEQLLNLVPKEKLSMCHFFLGRSYFALEDFKRAQIELLEYTKITQDGSPQFHLALITLLECARHMNDLPSFEKTLRKLEAYFPHGDDVARALFSKALIHKKLENNHQALLDFIRIENEYPAFSDREAFLFEYGHLLFLIEDFEKSRAFFKSHITEFPESKNHSLGWHFLIHASLKRADRGGNEEKNQLRLDLEAIIQRGSNFLSSREQKEYLFLLGKTNYSLGRYEDAIESLQTYIERTSDQPFVPEAHLLLAFAYKEGSLDLDSFCAQAEKALSFGVSFPNMKEVRLALYNAYLKLADDEKERDFDPIARAAEHLYWTQTYKDANILLENRLWLADYYYTKVMKNSWPEENEELQLYASRAESLLEKILLPQKECIGFDSSNVYLEGEFIKLAEIYQIREKFEEEIALLERMLDQYDNQPSLDWRYEKHTLFHLANANEKFGQAAIALEYYDKLLSEYPSLTSAISAEAALKSVKLRFASIAKTERNFENTELLSVLNRLKNLTIQRSLSNEPIHLEAAFTYVDIHCMMENQEKEIEKRSFLLSRMKEDFQSEVDIISKDYQNSRKQHPDKDQLYQAYMLLIDAEMLLCEAILVRGDAPQNSMKLKEEAHRVLQKMVDDKLILTQFLQERIQKDLQAFDNKHWNGAPL